MGALSHLRIVEVGDDSGAYAGKLLAELGAEVVRAVPHPLADIKGLHIDPDPFVQDFLHRSKHTVELPADPSASAAALTELVETADVLVEAGPPNLLERLGLPVDAACLQRDDLVRTRVSPYGLDGRMADQPASDLACSASAGFLWLGGWPDRAPTRAYGDQSWRMASLYAAVGTLVALVDRDRTGRGQQVEVSAQEAVATALENALQLYDLEGVVRTRTGPSYDEAGTGVYACADGYVYIMVGSLSLARGWENLMSWFAEADVAGSADLREPQWLDQAYRRTAAAQRRFREVFEGFGADRLKAQLYVEAQDRGIAICPINSPADLVASDHLRARDFFVEHDGLELVGPPYRLSATPWSTGPHVREEAR